MQTVFWLGSKSTSFSNASDLIIAVTEISLHLFTTIQFSTDSIEKVSALKSLEVVEELVNKLLLVTC